MPRLQEDDPDREPAQRRQRRSQQGVERRRTRPREEADRGDEHRRHRGRGGRDVGRRAGVGVARAPGRRDGDAQSERHQRAGDDRPGADRDDELGEVSFGEADQPVARRERDETDDPDRIGAVGGVCRVSGHGYWNERRLSRSARGGRTAANGRRSRPHFSPRSSSA
ncbi:hypothetical protein [Haloterrigena gelatinilytica]|uniref:hypothetical protein n=1 Tax=Haloterrigena gelatinilytica TaxID=2741724 RepID=UPI0020C6704A|nr:hypothetical protein [Haloterrigena gelatinilytica]